MIPLFDENPTHRTPVFTFAIIVLNVLVFILWQGAFSGEELSIQGAFVPAELAAHAPGSATHLFTSMFMHGGWMHLIGNMWFLWIFGDNVENATGPIRFVLFYVLTGVIATLAHMAVNPHSEVPLVGASGAISGVLGAYLVKHPNAPIRTLIPLGIFTQIVNIPAWVFLFVWIGMQVFSQVLMTSRHEHGAGVAYLAHIGGFIAGVVLVFVFQRREPQDDERRRRW